MTIDDLKTQRRWVLWKLEPVNGKMTKPPYQLNGFKASLRNPEHLKTYAELENYDRERFSGIGCALGDHCGTFLSGVDFDNARDPQTGEIAAEVLTVIRQLNSYTEVSPSGEGTHTWVIGEAGAGLQKPFPGCKQIEVKGDGYYQTFTGNQLPGSPETVEERPAEIKSLWQRVAATEKPERDSITVSVTPSEEERFAKLWAGDMSDHENNHSVADFALCCILAKKYKCSGFAMDREFRKSGLYRDDKWEREDYRERTINRAIQAVLREQGVSNITIGDVDPEAPKDWRSHYHTREETENAPKPEFLIEGFLQRQAIVGLAGYVGQKKSLIAQNVSYSLCSGEPLFGTFNVTRKPSRVLYLCPEMALIGFANRIRRIGLLQYVGETFFYATMSLKDGVIKLPDISVEEAQGAVIILDTAIRFIEGDENSSQHMKELANQAFQLIRSGAEAVIVLAHSNKEMVKSSELTLDNAMRGSSELTAFLSSCWATRLQDPEHPYESKSLLKHVKPRDFEADPFEVVTDRETCRMTFVEGSRGAVVARKPMGNVDGREADAIAIIRANLTLSLSNLVLKLKDSGIARKKTWVSQKRCELLGTGVTSTA